LHTAYEAAAAISSWDKCALWWPSACITWTIDLTTKDGKPTCNMNYPVIGLGFMRIVVKPTHRDNGYVCWRWLRGRKNMKSDEQSILFIHQLRTLNS
jgi:hypothetical protein